MKRENCDESEGQALGLLELPFIPATKPARPENTLPGPFPVSGFRYHDGPRCLPRLRVGEALTLHPEPGNPHDAFAVEILFGRAKFGYVPRFCNQRLSHLLAEGANLRCEVARLDADAPPWDAVAVRVSLSAGGKAN